jgi:hypothetical protein
MIAKFVYFREWDRQQPSMGLWLELRLCENQCWVHHIRDHLFVHFMDGGCPVWTIIEILMFFFLYDGFLFLVNQILCISQPNFDMQTKFCELGVENCNLSSGFAIGNKNPLGKFPHTTHQFWALPNWTFVSEEQLINCCAFWSKILLCCHFRVLYNEAL